jgi:hypothetical protein
VGGSHLLRGGVFLLSGRKPPAHVVYLVEGSRVAPCKGAGPILYLVLAVGACGDRARPHPVCEVLAFPYVRRPWRGLYLMISILR